MYVTILHTARAYAMESMMRTCTKCGEEKDLALFERRVKNGFESYRNTCNACRNAQRVEFFKSNPKKRQARNNRTLQLLKSSPERLEKKQARDRERQKRLRVEDPERVIKAELKRRETEGYKQWAAEYNKKQARVALDIRIEGNVGAYTTVTPVCCAICAKNEVRKGDYTHRPINARYCSVCADIPGNQIKGLTFKTISLCCSDCGSSFIGTGRTTKCDKCRRAESKAKTKVRNKALGVRKERGIERRAMRHGVYMEKVIPKNVYERDKWRCVSCKCKVIVSKVYHPRQASIDHIIPLSMGGSHTYGNSQTMCVSCNSSKSNNITSNVQLTVFDVVREPTYRGGIKIV